MWCGCQINPTPENDKHRRPERSRGGRGVRGCVSTGDRPISPVLTDLIKEGERVVDVCVLAGTIGEEGGVSCRLTEPPNHRQPIG
ncbi:hypothetical protein Hanom_Chr10g00901021 [Helianthus anomalus]